MQRGLGQTHMTVHKYATKHGETDVQTFAPAAFTFSLLSHLQPADGDMCIDTRYTHLPLSLLQSHCLSACCGPLFPLPREGGRMRALQPAPSHSSAGLCHVAFAGDQV